MGPHFLHCVRACQSPTCIAEKHITLYTVISEVRLAAQYVLARCIA